MALVICLTGFFILSRNIFKQRERNKIGKDGVDITPLFKWYSKDFEREMSIVEWINKYSDDKINPERKDFNYTEYSWKLNGKF